METTLIYVVFYITEALLQCEVISRSNQAWFSVVAPWPCRILVFLVF